jgi:hypothetical protein
MEEIWKDIKGYEGLYQVSNLGRVKSLSRLRFNNGGEFTSKEKILKPGKSKKYLLVVLYKNGKRKTFQVHQLVAMGFLGHKPCGMKMVVNHIDNNQANNRVCNLEIVSQRENSHTHHIGTSKYKGVCWDSARSKWASKIMINGKIKFLGRFNTEIEASIAYQNKLKEIIN